MWLQRLTEPLKMLSGSILPGNVYCQLREAETG